MTLRQKVIEAGARALCDGPNTEFYCEGHKDRSAAALDAMLDCLTENADEWVKTAGKVHGYYPHRYVMDGLLAVLREDR